jgi:hypothetical protein
MVGSAASQSFPPPLMIKQEPRDFAYDSGKPVHLWNFTYLLCQFISAVVRWCVFWLFFKWDLADFIPYMKLSL